MVRRFSLVLTLILFVHSIPIQIVKPNEDHLHLLTNYEGLKWLSSINEPISIIGMVGPYHSGKSYLLNAISGTSGFQIGPSTRPETMGLWILDTELRSPVDNSRILLLDSEGFYGSDVAESYDAKIFAITSLLSSHLVYNSIKLIDQASVEYLELLARRTQLFNLKNNIQMAVNTSIQLPKVLKGEEFPPFTWVVKDFIQKMDDRTPSQWLEEYINGQRDTGINEMSDKGLKDIFTNGLFCHTLFLPATNLNDLQDLSKVPEDRLTPEFLGNLRNLKNDLLSNTKAKKTDQGDMTGPSLAFLINFLVISANENRFPSVPSLWTGWISKLLEDAHKDAFDKYTADSKILLNTNPPYPEDAFSNLLEKAQQNATQIFQELLFGFENLYGPESSKLAKLVKDTFSGYADINTNNIRNLIRREKNSLLENVQKSFQNLTYPIFSAGIKKLYEVESKAKTDIFVDSFSRYSKSPIYAEYKTELERLIVAERDAALNKNSMIIKDLLEAGANSAMEEYNRVMEKNVNPLPSSVFLDEHVKAFTAASNAFKSVAAKNQTWLEKERDYQARFALMEKEVLKQKDIFNERNEKRIEGQLNKIVIDILREAQSKQDTIPLPDEIDVLQAKSIEISSNALSSLKNQMALFSDTKAYKNATRAIDREREVQVDAIMKENVSRTKALCYKALNLCAHNELTKEHCTFCISGWIPALYTTNARSIALRCMDKDPSSKHISARLKEHVITEWIKVDLSSELNTVYQKMMLISIIGVILVMLGVFAFTSQPKASEKKKYY
eukprot:TRINITY_DN1627_c0_g1_i1.p1 TRINITY_DN1627_c0_g1~~TRINITY_DN1627_c0_g1_i1.p1  ORF type:complete len:784 (+),score=206.83 TRINITY_DN1627_c0_g1_i1:20-2371(+)